MGATRDVPDLRHHRLASAGLPAWPLCAIGLAAEGLAGFLIPRADAHQGEYVAPRDERLQWLTGFTGSAGFCIVLPAIEVSSSTGATAQVKGPGDLAHFTPVPWPETKPGPWIRDHLAAGCGWVFDPWLHSEDEIARLTEALEGSGITLRPVGATPSMRSGPISPARPRARPLPIQMIWQGKVRRASGPAWPRPWQPKDSAPRF